MTQQRDPRRESETGGSDGGAGQRVRSIRLSEDHGHAAWGGGKVNPNGVERLWRQEGLKVPAREPKRRRPWLTDGSCVRLRPTHRNHVWSDDFVHERTEDGRAFRLLRILDESTRECLTIDVARRIDVLERLAELLIERGVPASLRSDNGSGRPLVSGHDTSSLAVLGRMATWRV